MLAAAAVAALYLILDLRTGDLAAHLYRADLFAREGFTIWNGNWYGGHHTPAYSVLFPPLAHYLTPQVAGAIAAVVAAALFEQLARAQFGERAKWGALWFGVAVGVTLFTGRLPFLFGTAVGLGALLALQRGHVAIAAVLAVAVLARQPRRRALPGARGARLRGGRAHTQRRAARRARRRRARAPLRRLPGGRLPAVHVQVVRRRARSSARCSSSSCRASRRRCGSARSCTDSPPPRRT